MQYSDALAERRESTVVQRAILESGGARFQCQIDAAVVMTRGDAAPADHRHAQSLQPIAANEKEAGPLRA